MLEVGLLVIGAATVAIGVLVAMEWVFHKLMEKLDPEHLHHK